MKLYWADKEKNVSRGRRRKGDVWTRARRKREEARVVGTVRQCQQSFEFGRYWCTCGRPQTSFLEIKTTRILRSLRGTQ